MFHRIRDYALALAAVLAAYVLYAQTVARMIEPPSIVRKDGSPAPIADIPGRKHPFQHLFQAGDWELNSPKVLETSQGTLLFLDYKPVEQGRLEIRPCTLILYSGSDEQGEISQSARPIVIRAGEGAQLQFDGEVDLARGQFGRLIGGRILGDIRLYSPESQPGAGDALELTTRNLRIDRLRAWTPSEVQFRYGSSYGSGHDLEMMLTPSERADGKSKALPVGGIDSVQLAQVNEIHLETKQGSLLPVAGEPQRSSSEPQPPVQITCDGPLKFDINRRVATLDDNVLVQRLTVDGAFDRLQCEQLAIFLTTGGETGGPSAAPSKREGEFASGDVERIVAIGKPVVLDAPSQRAYTTAERLEYNLKTKQLLLKSLDSGARVLLRREADEFTAPELVYEVVEGNRLGKLWAPGPGRLVAETGAGDDKRTFAAEWKGEIRIRPDQANQLISLTDGAKVDVHGRGSFQADEIHFWVTELPSVERTLVRSDTSGLKSVLPDRLLATGHVRADSPQLSADVDRLEAWFNHTPADLSAPARSSPPSAAASDELSLNPAQGHRTPELRQPVVRIQEPPASGSAGASPPHGASPSSKPVQHFHVTGEIIRMQVEQQGRESTVEQISVTGRGVRITETNAASGEKPLWLAGTQLDLEGGVGPEAFITVTGEPAVVSARGATVRSPTLKLSRRDNRVTIEQAGDMTLPIQQDFQGQKLNDAQEITITWKGSMVFDGSAARFRRGVVVRAATFWASAEELQAILTSRIDFGASAEKKRPELKRLVLSGDANLENHTFSTDDGRQQAVEHMSARSLDVDRVTGEIRGDGPGWLSRVQVGSPRLPGTEALPMPPRDASANEGLTYLRVDFRKQVAGNLHRRQVEFADQIQAVHGPVQHWDDIVDPRSRESLGERGMVLTTDRLQLADFLPPGAKKGSLEMTAIGGTKVEGRDFTASAHRLTFTAAKNQLVLEGDGRNDAEIRHQYQNSVAAQKIYFWQDTGAIQMDGVKNLNLGPTARPGVGPPRSPRDYPR